MYIVSFCTNCKKNILIDYTSFNDIRGKYFSCSSLKDLYANVDSHSLLDFDNEIHFMIASSAIILFLY